jgi:hypothetical protein
MKMDYSNSEKIKFEYRSGTGARHCLAGAFAAAQWASCRWNGNLQVTRLG